MTKQGERPANITASRRPCPACHGSGQTASFLGVSRFLLTWEDCPECAGVGVVEDAGGTLRETDAATGSCPND